MSDPFRDTWLRYLGYANEVGEAFRPVVPRKLVTGSYAVASGYVVADTVDKAIKKRKEGGTKMQMLNAAGDTLLWQTLASIIIPGLVINRISSISRGLLCKPKFMKPKIANFLSVGISLAFIPFIIYPIDTGVTLFMDATIRRFTKYKG